MSNRFERTADKKTLEKHQKILKDLLAQPENKICADCKKRDPRWASANLGIFICLRCSGIHRSLGVHISKVRSVDLDTWTAEHIEIMQLWGNAKANKYWEHSLGENNVPDDARIESFIRNKYEYKKFCMPGPIPNPATFQTSNPPKSLSPPAAQPPSIPQVTQPAPSGWADFGSFASAPAATAPTVQQPVTQVQNQSDLLGLNSSSQQNMKSNILNLYSQSPSRSSSSAVPDFGAFSAAAAPAKDSQLSAFSNNSSLMNYSGFDNSGKGNFGMYQPVASFTSSQGFTQNQNSMANHFGSASQQPLFSSFTSNNGSSAMFQGVNFSNQPQAPIFGGSQGHNFAGSGNDSASHQQKSTTVDPFASLSPSFGSSQPVGHSTQRPQQQQQSNLNWAAF